MEIIETPVFTKRVAEILSEEEYRELQSELIRDPRAGALIPGCGGLRKLRWRIRGKGKRGGIRLIYYVAFSRSIMLMVFLYRKSETGDLTQKQLKILRDHIQGDES